MIGQAVSEYITEELAADRQGLTLEARDDLVAQGILDSMGILQLVTFLEQEFRITIGDDDILPENFASLENIERFVQAKRASS